MASGWALVRASFGAIPLVGADFFRGCLVVLRVVEVATGCERRRFVSALLYRFAWVAARWCGFFLPLLLWWRGGFGLRGRRLRLISALLWRLCLGSHPLVPISSGAFLLLWWKGGFGLRGRRLRLISALLWRLCLGYRWCRFLLSSGVCSAQVALV